MKGKIEKLKEGEKTAGISTIAILLLSLAEYLVGFLSGSIVLITDALHNAADSIVSFASWFGLKISQKKPSEKFPYGYYKAESLVTFFISGFILYAAFELILEGYSKLFTISKLTMPFEALIISLISLVTSFFLARYMSRVGYKINSQSLIANSQERMTHVFSSAIVFITILLTFYRVPYVEGIVTILFSLMIFKIGIFTARDSIFALMDVAPKEIERDVKKILNSISGVEDFEELKLRKSGPFVFGEVKIKIRKHVDVKRAHEIADNIENKIKEKIGQIDSFTIHIEPYETEEQKIAIPIMQDKGLDSELMEKFGKANYFMFLILDKKEGNVKSTYVKENPHKSKAVKAGLFAAKFLAKEKVDVLITKEIGEISFHTLRDNLIDIYKAKGRKVKDIINEFMKNKLERLDKPTREEKEIEEKPERVVYRGWGRRGWWWRGRGPWWRR